jgi:hypothetical protein
VPAIGGHLDRLVTICSCLSPVPIRLQEWEACS